MRDYNGVTLPDLPDVDSSVYPYCFIRDDTKYKVYDLFYSQNKPNYSSTMGMALDVAGPRYKVVYSAVSTATEWSANGILTTPTPVSVASGWPIIWANFDIYDSKDGSLYLAGEYEKPDADAVLSLSVGGEAAGATVTVNFSCTGLSSAEAVYQVCLYAYRQGGTYTAAEVVCQTELFAGPSFSGSCTFTGLNPETAYEVYGVICRDGAELAVTALAAFTTPEEVSSAPAYIGDTNGVARQLECIYIGDANGIARKVLRVYVGTESGLAALCWGSASGGA